MKRQKQSGGPPQIRNPRARFDLSISRTFTAGMILSGAEVKSLRSGRGSLRGAFVSISKGAALLKNASIPALPHFSNPPPERQDRRLLLHRREIEKIETEKQGSGMTAVPLRIFFQRGFAKVEIGLGRGQKHFEKRERIKQQDLKRRLQRRLHRDARS